MVIEQEYFSISAFHMSIEYSLFSKRGPLSPIMSFVIPLFRKFLPTNRGFCVILTEAWYSV